MLTCCIHLLSTDSFFFFPYHHHHLCVSPQEFATMATITVTIGPVMAGMTAAKSHSRISTINTSKFATQLGFATSEFSGMKISIPQFDKITPAAISAPLRRSLQPVSRRVCPFTGKKSNKKNLVSHSNHRTITRQFVNLQYKKIWWEAGKRFVKLRLSTNAIKTIEKNGLDAMAKKAGIDLRKL